MKAAGTVVNLTRQGHLVLRATKALKIGSAVSDPRNNPAGRVADVIGPVAAPYLVVVGNRPSAGLLGKELYAR